MLYLFSSTPMFSIEPKNSPGQAADKVMSAVIFCAKKWKTEKEYGIIEAEKS